MSKPQKLKYHHLGIPTTKPIGGEVYLKDYKTLPHVAFEVDDIYEAIKDKHVIIQSNSPSEGNIVAFIEENGAPIEFIQIGKP